jgi:hypothetical protein
MLGATFYVSPSGSGSACSQAAPCATLAAALTAAGSGSTQCGDVVELAAGTIIDNNTTAFSFNSDCSTSGGLTIRGAGVSATTWLAGLSALTNCTLVSGSIYECDEPSGTTNGNVIIQDLVGTVDLADTGALTGNGTTSTMSEWVMISARTSYSLITQAGTFFRCDGTTCATSKVRVWGFNNETPSSTTFYDPTFTSASGAFQYGTSSKGLTLEDMTIVSGSGKFTQIQGDDINWNDITLYLGELWVLRDSGCNGSVSTTNCAAGAADGFDATNVKVLNVARRCINTADGNCDDTNSNSDGVYDGENDWAADYNPWVTRGSNFTYTNIETAHARNGFIIGQSPTSATDGTCSHGVVNGFKFRGHYNHGFQVGDYCQDIAFYNGEHWASQEAVFLSGCAHDLTFAYNTLVNGSFQTANVATACTGSPMAVGGQWNITLCNNILSRLLTSGVAGRAGQNYDTYNNLWVDAAVWASAGSQDYVRLSGVDCTFDTPTDYRNWTFTGGVCSGSDPCTNCTRDTSTLEVSGSSSYANTFTTYPNSIKNDALTRDLTPLATSAAINAANTSTCATTITTDITGASRGASPDIGAYERGGVVSPSQSPGTISTGVKFTGVQAK